LACETLLKVVDIILQDNTNTAFESTSVRAVTRLSPLSRTCKRLNAVCGRRIFHQYRLSLYPSRATEIHLFSDPGSLAHALRKADYIQELIISGGDIAEDAEALDECIQTSLTELIRSTPRMISVILASDVQHLSSTFWSALLAKPLRYLDIQGWQSISAETKIKGPLVLDKLALCYHPNTIGLLEDARARQISVDYTSAKSSADLPFRPANAHIREIYVKAIPNFETSKRILDFSAVPQARIHVEIPFSSISYQDNQTSSRMISELLPSMFTESLEHFNVYRKFDTCFIVSRPSLSYYPTWRPMFQDHLDDNQRDKDGIYAHWTNKMTR